MPYIVRFDRDKVGKFNPHANFVSVVYGTEGIYLEDTMNEMQWLSYHNIARFVRGMVGSGILERNIDNVSGFSSSDYALGTGANPILTMANFTASMHGYIATVTNALANGATGFEDGKNKIALGTAPSSGTRDDLLYLEVWFEEVKAGDALTKNGTEGADAILNQIDDSREAEETDRRVQMKSRLVLKQGVNFAGGNTFGMLDGSIKAKGGNETDSTLTFSHATYLGDNIFVAGNGSNTHKTMLESVTGSVYAMALFKFTRRVGVVTIDAGDVVDFRRFIQNYGQLADILNSHIGEGGNAHQLADGTTAGFMSSALFTELTSNVLPTVATLMGGGNVEEHYHLDDRNWFNIVAHPNFPANLNGYVVKSDSTISTSSSTLATSNAVRITMDYAKQVQYSLTLLNNNFDMHVSDPNLHRDTWRPITDSVAMSSSEISASANAVRIAYNYAGSAYTRASSAYSYAGSVSTALTSHIGDVELHKDTWRPITDSVSTVDSDTSASASAVKSAYDRGNSAYTLAQSAQTKADNAQTKADSAYTLAQGKWTYDLATLQGIKVTLAGDAEKLGGVIAANFMRKDTAQTMGGTLTIGQGKLLQKTASTGTTYTIIDDDAKVWRAAANDLAELMVKSEWANLEAGDVLVQTKDGLNTTDIPCDGRVVGVYSDTYGFLLGGEDGTKSVAENSHMVPVGISGRVRVKVKGKVSIGDMLVTSNERGYARATFRSCAIQGTMFTKALEEFDGGSDGEGKTRIWALIVNC